MKPRLSVSPAQLKLMSYGPRREIVAILANEPDLSMKQLAARLHRSVTSLYRHIDLLIEADLVRQSGARDEGRRPEARYALTFSGFTSDKAMETPAGRTAIAEAAARYASAVSRKLSRAVEEERARIHTDDANAGYFILDLQLNRAGLLKFNALLRDFLAEARRLRVREAEDVETVAMAILVAPHRAA